MKLKLLLIFLCSLKEKRCERTIFSKQRKEFFFLFLLALAFSQVQRSQCLVEAMYFGTRFSVKCSLCTHAHIQHSRHEVWDERSEQKRKVPRSASSHRGPFLLLLLVAAGGGGEYRN